MKQTSIFGSFVFRKPPSQQSSLPTEQPLIEKTPSRPVLYPNQAVSAQKTPDVRIDALTIYESAAITTGKSKCILEENAPNMQTMGSAKLRKRKMEIDDEAMDCESDAKSVEDEEFACQDARSPKTPGKANRKSTIRENKTLMNHGQAKPNIAREGMGMTEEAEKTKEFSEVIPVWATFENHRDAMGRRPGEEGYDETTLLVPTEALSGFTEAMRQYWKIKSSNYDKVILFKLGKFYELFFEDALIGNKEFDLKWMGTKMHVGFPEKALERYGHELVRRGYKVVVVEQTESVEKMKKRIVQDKNEGRKSQKIITRGVVEILTKGTIVPTDEADEGYLQNFLLSVIKKHDYFAFVLLDLAANTLYVGNAINFEKFKTVLYQTRPSELLYDPDNLSGELVMNLKNGWLQMSITKLNNKDSIWHPLNSQQQLEDLIASGTLQRPKVMEYLRNLPAEEANTIYAAMSGLFCYLKKCVKFDSMMNAVKFGLYQYEKVTRNMVLDSQALQHLEIFQTACGTANSLFKVIDRTSTTFGRRMLRKWVMQPLLAVKQIEDRLDAVEDLQRVSNDRDRLVEVLKKMPDLERIVNRLYRYSLRNTEKANYFHDVNTSRLKTFKDFLQNINTIDVALELLKRHRKQFKSRRLVQLLTSEEDVGSQHRNSGCVNDIYEEDDDEQLGSENMQENQQSQEKQPVVALLPSLQRHLAEFEAYVFWEDGLPVPQKGLIESYDRLKDKAQSIKDELEEYLEGVRIATRNPNIKFVDIKERYEMEVCEKDDHKNPPNFTFVSKRQGYSRYVTAQSRKLVEQLEEVEDQVKDQMGTFVGFFFEEFRKKQKSWERYVSTVAEIDCLVSLSLYSAQSRGARPEFVADGFEIFDAVHPCLKEDKSISNDINLEERVMLLTGPNMGGKSTLLRTTCLLAILAQVGCYVSASVYRCQIIDRIFTRIGASDRLDMGKSTFFIEMEETKSVLEHATTRSLAIIDELGRGTSTFDGMSIAYAVLEEILRIGCRCMFSTHYHSLSEEFQHRKGIQHCVMDYLVQDKRLIFLYKLRKGAAGMSFGINVARAVNISEQILEQMQIRSQELRKEINAMENRRMWKSIQAKLGID